MHTRTEQEVKDMLADLEREIKAAQANGEDQKVKLWAMYAAGINWFTYNCYNTETEG
jgi:hypothetical protein